MRALPPLRSQHIPAYKKAATAPTTRPASFALVLNSAAARPSLRARRPASSSSRPALTSSSWTAQTTTRFSRPFATRPEPPQLLVKMTAPYEETLKGKYPGTLHAKRVAEYIRSKIPGATAGVIYLEGGKTRMIEDCDQEEHFRQRRHFYYLTGCDLPDCHYTYDIATGESTLFVPPVDAESVVWSGLPLSTDEALQQYDVHHAALTTDVNPTLARLAKNTSSRTVFAIPGQVSDHVTFLGFEDKNLGILKEAIEYSRVIKSDYEVALIQKASDISSAAHRAVMERVRRASNETELEAVLLSHFVSRGSKNQAYSTIVAGGRSAATLHYVRNDQPLAGKLNLLLDAGCEINCYASDITRTFPISGRFTPESRAVYDIVLKMQLESIAMLREGVNWDDVHAHAHRVAIDGLLGLGVLKGDREEVFRSKASVAFFPHGLGHYMGMDTHDTGGDPDYADPDPMFRYLRKRGALPAGSVITVEPGIYFCKFIIDPALKDPATARHIDAGVLERYWDVGGVRIEDNVLITKEGCENFTSVVKDPVELERIISSS